MNFLVDAPLPPALARWISARGHQAAHVLEIAMLKADDPDIWEHARRQPSTSHPLLSSSVVLSENQTFGTNLCQPLTTLQGWFLKLAPLSNSGSRDASKYARTVR